MCVLIIKNKNQGVKPLCIHHLSPRNNQLVEPCSAAAANSFHNILVANGQMDRISCVCSSAQHSILDGYYFESFLSIRVCFADHSCPRKTCTNRLWWPSSSTPCVRHVSSSSLCSDHLADDPCLNYGGDDDRLA
jgi:hypothetical protein